MDYVLGAGDRFTPERKDWVGRVCVFQRLMKLEVFERRQEH